MTIPQAELRLGIPLTPIGLPVPEMLNGQPVSLGAESLSEVKNTIYRALTDYLNVAGYPTEANEDFREASINDLVSFTIYPIIAAFQHEKRRRLYLSREKEIASKDLMSSGREEFVVLDFISVAQKKYVCIVEAKKVSLGEARKQCFLAMKDMRDANGGGMVYGFITMGDSWRMVSFNGEFKMSEKIELLFDSLPRDKKRWMDHYSILVDCFNVALSNGANDPIVLAPA
ncbi:hypothetical protein B9Z19DRAFT_1131492 [Tuber borchii]|uniref:Type I restriction enzyme R protein N-terminal domain-containing protein n=1 Tax=Tuber borchii TaxID=42251 RepID=A0A2T6ZIN7_TUBBO|nr:hypothetical protein B9Z19DRAFT_1131492 [Tuber borchii]